MRTKPLGQAAIITIQLHRRRTSWYETQIVLIYVMHEKEWEDKKLKVLTWFTIGKFFCPNWNAVCSCLHVASGAQITLNLHWQAKHYFQLLNRVLEPNRSKSKTRLGKVFMSRIVSWIYVLRYQNQTVNIQAAVFDIQVSFLVSLDIISKLRKWLISMRISFVWSMTLGLQRSEKSLNYLYFE